MAQHVVSQQASFMLGKNTNLVAKGRQFGHHRRPAVRFQHDVHGSLDLALKALFLNKRARRTTTIMITITITITITGCHSHAMPYRIGARFTLQELGPHFLVALLIQDVLDTQQARSNRQLTYVGRIVGEQLVQPVQVAIHFVHLVPPHWRRSSLEPKPQGLQDTLQTTQAHHHSTHTTDIRTTSRPPCANGGGGGGVWGGVVGGGDFSQSRHGGTVTFSNSYLRCYTAVDLLALLR